MGTKPFRVAEQQPQNQPAALVGRGVDGKFAHIEAQTPHELREEARTRGVMVQEVAKLRQAPDHEVTGANIASEAGDYATYSPALPWPAAVATEGGRPPFKGLR